MRTRDAESAVPLYVIRCPRCDLTPDKIEYATMVSYTCICGWGYDRDKPTYVEDRFMGGDGDDDA